MTPFVFDTLSASKQLREAGMAEGVAEAVVSVFQHASAMPDISHLATKGDLDAQGLLIKADFDAQGVSIRADLDLMKADIGALQRDMATRTDIAELRADFGARLLQQTWMMIGGVTALVTMVNVMLKIFD